MHLFVVTTGDDGHDALAFVRDLWNKCGEILGMTVPLEGTGTGLEPGNGWDACLPGVAGSTEVRGTRGLLAARRRSGPGVWQAALRREHDFLCLSVMLAPDAADGLSWAELDAQWSEVVRAQRREAGVLGSARLYTTQRCLNPGVHKVTVAGAALSVHLSVLRAPRPPAEPARIARRRG
ncbi:CATRA conflict system CASPASE/TPR repeat-associated protein [Streptomyces sp. NPDC094032]|uniref:CATRA conflict system CASPASE/TPR repeat-associated protein n=1 Tax=Streptomyces sp. NPDC094032 TaxID=3155308 RepID=UPI003322C6D3